MNHKFNPELDLMLERIVDVPCELVWEAWTCLLYTSRCV